MPEMIKVNAKEFQRHLGHYSDLALRQPVTVTRNGRERTVMMSVEEYHRLKRRDREVLAAEEFTAEDLALIAKSEPPAESANFNHELDE